MRRILVVDDEPSIREILDFSLAAEGFEVIQAPDGEDALLVAGALRPDLIILDVMMPRLDGIETCRQLKADSRTRDIPVILLTARVTPGDRRRGEEARADAYVTKPFSPRRLVETVRKFLSVCS